jgi:4-hydroxy-2-oxoglutarate aldolase
MIQKWPHTMPALITPFGPDESINIDAHRHNVSVAASVGAQGVLLAGSTGEGPYLEADERAALVSSARGTAADLVILCGISAETDRQAAPQIDEAAASGADAILVITPGTLVRGRTNLISDYYERIADLSPLPVFLYSNPVVTGYELPVEAVRYLAQHPDIVGMKDSGGDVARLDELADVLTDGFVVYIGSSKKLAESTRRGAYGAITASANYAFSLVEGATSQDEESQTTLTEVTSIVQQYGVPGTKYAAALAGMDEGRSRLPLESLDGQAKRIIAEAYEDILS